MTNLKSLTQARLFQLVVRSLVFFLSIFLLHLSGGSFLLQLLIVLMGFSLYGFESKRFFQFFFPFLYSLILSFFSAFNFRGLDFLISSFSASVVFFISLGLRNNYFIRKREWNYVLANFIFFYALFEFNSFRNIEMIFLLPLLFLFVMFLFVGSMSVSYGEDGGLAPLKNSFLKSSVLALLISESFFVSRLILSSGEFVAYFLSLIAIIASFFLVFRERVSVKGVIISFFALTAFVFILLLF